MSRRARPGKATALAFAFTATTIASHLGAQTPADRGGRPVLDRLPARFVPNRGQWDSPELYRVRVGGLQVFLERGGWSFWLNELDGPSVADRSVADGARPCPSAREGLAQPAGRAIALRMRFVGAREAELVAEQPLAGSISYLVGSDAGRHRAGLTAAASVLYRSVYPGVDVRLRTNGGCLEYDLLLEPGADLEQVLLRVDGADSLEIDDEGRLVAATQLGPVVQPQPRTWMVGADGERGAVECRYRLRGGNVFGFAAPARDPSAALVVDPQILYSTMYGGSDFEYVRRIVEDATGRILVTGRTQSLNFPTTTGVLQPAFGSATNDGFVVLLDPSQPPASQIVFATYFGGDGDESVNGAAFLPGGLIAFAGGTSSTNLPVTAGAYQTANAGGFRDGYVGTMLPNGTAIASLTYLGDVGNDQISSLQVMPGGFLLACGQTTSAQFPVTATAYQGVHKLGANGFDGHLTILDTTVTTVAYATFLGGTGDEWLECSGVDAAGVATVHGGTSSVDFPVTATAFQSGVNGGNTGWWGSYESLVARLDPTLPPAQQLVYATYVGGSGQEWIDQSVVTATGDIVAAGTTTSTDFPVTPDSYAPTYFGGLIMTQNSLAGDGFVVRLDPSSAGSAGMVWGTFFGSVGPDQGLDCTVDSTGEVTLVGWTQSNALGFTTTPDALQRTYIRNEGFVARFSPDGRQLLYSTLLGGSNHDGAWLATNHADAQPTITGATVSFNYPVVNANGAYSGAYDTFVTRMSLIPDNTTRYGASSGAGGRYPTIHALGDNVPGNASFGIACSRAPAGGAGIWVAAGAPAPGVPFSGIGLNVDVMTIFGSSLVVADMAGEHTLPLPLPPTPVTGVHFQYLWLESAMPLQLSASDGLRL